MLNQMSGYVDGCIEFYDDTHTQLYSRDYILIRNTDESGTFDKGCWSYIGFVHPDIYQPINLVGYYGTNCFGKTETQRQMLHALGFHYEHRRPDRDEYVDVLYENISPFWQGKYRKMDASIWDSYETIYDYRSIMHFWGDSHRTYEAKKAETYSMVYKGTNDPVRPGTQQMSSTDIIQLT